MIAASSVTRQALVHPGSLLRGCRRYVASDRSLACAAEKPDIRRLAELAHIQVSEEEIRDWEPKLSSITDWFGQLQAIDLDSVAPLLRAPSTTENRTRKDAVVRHTLSDIFLDTVPDREGDFIKVPKISTGADQ